MNEADVIHYITTTFEGVDVSVDSGNQFYYYNPEASVPPDYRLMFATLVTNDLYDQFSNLDRPSVYRLNIGITKPTFSTLFGGQENAADSEYDYTTLDEVMPHPDYGRMHWVCVLSPSEDTFKTTVRPLMTEAYDLAVSKHTRLETRKQG